MEPKHVAFGVGLAVAAAMLLKPRRVGAASATCEGGSEPDVERWRSVVDRVAGPAGVPTDLVLAIIAKESHGDPNARSGHPGDLGRGGAFGLMQMTWTTAKALGYRGEPSGLLDPMTNITLGVALIKQDMRRFDNNHRDVIAAYNSGQPFDRAPSTTKNDYVPAVEGQRGCYA